MLVVPYDTAIACSHSRNMIDRSLFSIPPLRASRMKINNGTGASSPSSSISPTLSSEALQSFGVRRTSFEDANAAAAAEAEAGAAARAAEDASAHSSGSHAMGAGGGSIDGGGGGGGGGGVSASAISGVSLDGLDEMLMPLDEKEIRRISSTVRKGGIGREMYPWNGIDPMLRLQAR